VPEGLGAEGMVGLVDRAFARQRKPASFPKAASQTYLVQDHLFLFPRSSRSRSPVP